MRVNGRPWLFAPELQMLLGYIVRLELIDIGPHYVQGAYRGARSPTTQLKPLVFALPSAPLST